MSEVYEPAEPGYLLRELGYIDEIEAATAVDVTPKTMIEYRKLGIGPEFTEVARKIMYSKTNLAKWLEKGGTRGRAA